MQGNKWLLAVVSGVAAISLASPAMATMMSAPDGWYIELNAGSAHLSNDDYPGSTTSSGIGYNGNLGYKFMPYVGVEGGYSTYPDTKIKNEAGSRAADVRHYSYDLALKAILPVSDSGFEGFAKIGVGRMVSNIKISDAAVATPLGVDNGSHSSTGVYMGVGAQFYFTPEIAVVAQWQRAQGNSSTGSEDLFGIGVNFLFV
jgi:hypothetical protein